MTSLASLLGSGIKSIQRGTITCTAGGTATATISAVNTAKTELRFLGATQGKGNVVLTNSTTITATGDGSITTVVSFEITERY